MDNAMQLPLSHRVRRVALGGILAASLVGGGALAAPSYAFAETGSVTINSVDNDGATYNAYQFFTADVDNENNATHIAFGIGVNGESLATFLNNYGYDTWLTDNTKGASNNAQNQAEFISEQISKSAGANSPVWVNSDTFADELAHWAVQNLSGQAQTATEGAAFTGNEGYYLFVSSQIAEEGGIGTAPIWFPLGGSATTIDEKASAPTITKTILENDEAVDYADVEINDEVTYQVTTTLPGNYHTFDSFYFRVADNIPAGMTVDTSKVTVMYGDTNITDQLTINADQNNKLTVTAEDLKALDYGFKSGDTITITYTVDLNDLDEIVFGGTGNINGATLTYSNNPYTTEHGTIESEKTYVYTFQISLDKTDASTGVPLEGASFIVNNEEGKYLVADGDSYSWTAEKAGATQFTTDKNGNIAQMPGLDAGKYTLTETVAPDNYVVPGLLGSLASFDLTVTPAYDEAGKLTGLNASVSSNAALNPSIAENGIDVSQGMINIDVTNDRVISLALTGAQGAGLIGVIVIAAGAAIYLYRRTKATNAE